MKRKSKNLQILFRCLSNGDKTILVTPEGEYVAIQCKKFESFYPEGTEEKTIESRIQFELYREYPLQEHNQLDWDKRIKKAFRLNE